MGLVGLPRSGRNTVAPPRATGPPATRWFQGMKTGVARRDGGPGARRGFEHPFRPNHRVVQTGGPAIQRQGTGPHRMRRRWLSGHRRERLGAHSNEPDSRASFASSMPVSGGAKTDRHTHDYPRTSIRPAPNLRQGRTDSAHLRHRGGAPSVPEKGQLSIPHADERGLAGRRKSWRDRIAWRHL